MLNNSDIEALVRKFVANQASEGDIELLQEYFKTPVGLKCLGDVMDEHAADFDESPLSVSGNDAMQPLRIREQRKKTSFGFANRVTRAIAASFIGIALVAIAYLFVSDRGSVTVYQTKSGEKATLTLPDNTVVTLNGNTTLSYRGNWSKAELRSVELSGEAYFSVTSNPQKPFVVNTSDIAIRVLGTTFNVKSYDEDEEVETTLLEGKVMIEKTAEVGAKPETINLLPDQKATFRKDSKQIALETVDSENEASWITGTLIFEDEPFSEIIKDLQRRYGVKITVSDTASLACRFNTTIEGESLEKVLELFSLSGNVKYHFKNPHDVWIEGTLCEERMN
jgi:ferric-dicitrate binding protein FerR (iron transport regulator)